MPHNQQSSIAVFGAETSVGVPHFRFPFELLSARSPFRTVQSWAFGVYGSAVYLVQNATSRPFLLLKNRLLGMAY